MVYLILFINKMAFTITFKKILKKRQDLKKMILTKDDIEILS